MKQLSFLRHIVTLESSDPVLKSYRQQLQYPEAPNWVNQVAQLRSIYNISEEVAKLSKKVWKEKIKKQVRNRALLGLNNELKNQKKAQSLPPYHNLVSQDYITTLSPKIARKVFHIRTGIIDLRTVRTYKYSDNVSCRLCLEEEEPVEHVVNRLYLGSTIVIGRGQ